MNKGLKFIFSILLCCIVLISCVDKTDKIDYKQGLFSKDKNKIIEASYQLGEIRDTTSVKDLLKNSLDPRISHNLKFYGVSVNYSRLTALQKISNNAYKEKIKQHEVDTTATIFFRDWAIQQKYLKNETEIDINYY